MSLHQGDIAKFLEKFWIEHYNGRTFEEAAKASSVGSSTIKRFAGGAYNIGFSNMLGIVEDALNVPFLHFAVELNDLELEKTSLNSKDTVRDSSGSAAYGRKNRKGRSSQQPLIYPEEQVSLTLEEMAEQEAQARCRSILAQCSDKAELRQLLKMHEYNAAVEERISRKLTAYLK